MSTVSSPRLSLASTPISSHRPSLEQQHPNNPSITSSPNVNLSASSTPTGTASRGTAYRRNRAALRDYYNLKPASVVDSTSGASGTALAVRSQSSLPGQGGNAEAADEVSSSSPTTSGSVVNTELDSPNFDAKQYVEQLLATASLATVLKAENTLVGDIRTLDGERKALVYNNYSRLIRAVETIGTMRQSMEERGAPLTMTTRLGPTVGFIAETAGAIIQDIEVQQQQMKEAGEVLTNNGLRKLERDTVNWVLGAPGRLRTLLSEGKNDEATQDWAEVDALLKKWGGVEGVADVRTACEDAMRSLAGV